MYESLGSSAEGAPSLGAGINKSHAEGVLYNKQV